MDESSRILLLTEYIWTCGCVFTSGLKSDSGQGFIGIERQGVFMVLLTDFYRLLKLFPSLWERMGLELEVKKKSNSDLEKRYGTVFFAI